MAPVTCGRLPDDLKKIGHTVIQRNGYFAHPENIMIAMVVNDREFIPSKAVYCILYIGNSEKEQ